MIIKTSDDGISYILPFYVSRPAYGFYVCMYIFMLWLDPLRDMGWWYDYYDFSSSSRSEDDDGWHERLYISSIYNNWFLFFFSCRWTIRIRMRPSKRLIDHYMFPNKGLPIASSFVVIIGGITICSTITTKLPLGAIVLIHFGNINAPDKSSRLLIRTGWRGQSHQDWIGNPSRGRRLRSRHV